MAILITKIKEYREKANLKQGDLAQLVGVRRETIVHLEAGKYNPSLKLAMDIASVFQVSVEDLFEFKEEKNVANETLNEIRIETTNPRIILEN